jgi:hypothetical protein
MIAMRRDPARGSSWETLLMLIPGRTAGVAAFELGDQAEFDNTFDVPEESGE